MNSYLVGENDEVFLDAKIANGLEFRFGEDFTDRVVADIVLVHS